MGAALAGTRSARAFSPRRWARAAPGLLASTTIVALSLHAIARFVDVALTRLTYPFELEWMEGGVVTHIQVVMSGGQLYRAPSLDFTPFIYPPLYYYVSGAVSSVVGAGYLAPRLVSLSAIALCFALMSWWVRRETGDTVAGVATAGMFSATYAMTSLWFDVVRVDSLYLLLVLGGYSLVRFGETRRAAVTAGVLFGLAFFAKQSGLVLAIPAIVSLGLRSVRLALVAAGAFIAVALGGFLTLDWASGGWAHFYLFTVPASHEIFWEHWKTTLVTYLWTPVAVMSVAGAALVCGVGARQRSFPSWFFYASWVLVTSAGSLVYLLHTGGYPNVLLPAYAALSMAFGIELAALRRPGSDSWPGSAGRQVFAALAVIAQWLLLSWEPSSALPTATDLAEGRRVIRELERLPRPLWVTASSYYSVLAGQRDVVTHTMGIVDVLKATDPRARRLHDELVLEIRAHHFKTIVTDRAAGFLPPDLVNEIRRSYHKTGSLFRSPSTRAFWPKSGAEIRPDEIWQAN